MAQPSLTYGITYDINHITLTSLIAYAPIQRLDVEEVPLVGAGKEADAGGVGEGVDASFDDNQLLRSWRGKHKDVNHSLK